MKLSWTSIENWLSVGGMTFLGAAVGYVQTDMTQGLSGSMPWKNIIIGAALAGVASIVHLAQVPQQKGSPS